jgi:hypothetical protein
VRELAVMTAMVMAMMVIFSTRRNYRSDQQRKAKHRQNEFAESHNIPPNNRPNPRKGAANNQRLHVRRIAQTPGLGQKQNPASTAGFVRAIQLVMRGGGAFCGVCEPLR